MREVFAECYIPYGMLTSFFHKQFFDCCQYLEVVWKFAIMGFVYTCMPIEDCGPSLQCAGSVACCWVLPHIFSFHKKLCL